MSQDPILSAKFYCSLKGNELVREWLSKMSKQYKIILGTDIKLVQFRWPLGMPLVRKMENGLWENKKSIGRYNC